MLTVENEIPVATKGVVMIKAQKNITDQKLKDLKAKKISQCLDYAYICMKIVCFYSENGGFKISDEDKSYMQSCKVAVFTCAFGGGDDLYQPIGMSEASLKKIVQQIQNMMTHDKSDRETVLVRRMLQDRLLDVVCLKH
uniref:TOD1/MUCI70 glycosyltransferase-like domain-containing protein n=1 Tax=Gossypium raimondii TaxID=29730 RepID=A0A0D2UVW8_GOSRA|nr:hypothetical protein B456_011G198900 [Gossypium raimondii]